MPDTYPMPREKSHRSRFPPRYEDMYATLGTALNAGLPGLEAQMPMVPKERAMTGLPTRDYRHAAVLIALFRQSGQWRFPLILRTEDGRAHGGQVSLPGGRLKEGEIDEAGALREAQEEIGLDPSRVRVLGRLSPVPIPVSRHLVVPVLGMLETGRLKAPEGEVRTQGDPKRGLPWPLRLQESEVQDLFTITLEELLDPALRHREVMETVVGPMEVPFFCFYGHRVWGATAIILSELSFIARGLKPGQGLYDPSSTK